VLLPLAPFPFGDKGKGDKGKGNKIKKNKNS